MSGRSAPPGSLPCAGYRLEVIAGRQCGGSAKLPLGGSIVIGNGFDADVILRESALLARHATLHAMGDALLMDVIGDAAGVDDALHPAGARVTLSVPCSLKFGESIISLAPILSETQPPAQRPGQASSGRIRPRLLLAAPLLAVLSLILLLLIEPPVADESQRPALGDVLAYPELSGQQFSHLKIDESVNPGEIQGYVPTQQAYVLLQRVLGNSGLTYRLNVKVGEQMASRVIDTFRLNGIEALLVENDVHRLVLRTDHDDADEVGRVRAIVERDLPQLPALVVQTAPAAQLELPPEPPTLDAGKRVALVISRPPAHVLTEDRARYFVGALLPSGHRIRTIQAGRVALEKDGITTELQF